VAITSAAPASAPSNATAPGPRVSASQFQSYTPSLGHSSAFEHSAAAAAGAGQHTIVISTLALVLIVIIVVLLVR
jgi:hypothetical protein